LSRLARERLGELLDAPRVVRALGHDPWQALGWAEAVSRAEALSVEHLAPEEND
jgi:hypothetical protein